MLTIHVPQARSVSPYLEVPPSVAVLKFLLPIDNLYGYTRLSFVRCSDTPGLMLYIVEGCPVVGLERLCLFLLRLVRLVYCIYLDRESLLAVWQVPLVGRGLAKSETRRFATIWNRSHSCYGAVIGAGHRSFSSCC
jgi:hypothetical protein